MQFPIIYSDRFLYGDLNASHPERPRRLLAIVEALKKADWYEHLHWYEPKEREGDSIERWLREAHLPKYIKRVKLARKNYQRASLAVSAWLDGADLALATNQPVFVLSRPAGHHAERDRGMGFCVFCNAAIAAIAALSNSLASNGLLFSIGMSITVMARSRLSKDILKLLFVPCISFPVILGREKQKREENIIMFSIFPCLRTVP